LFTVSSATAKNLSPVLIFLNSKFSPVFCLNTPTPELPTLLTVFVSPASSIGFQVPAEFLYSKVPVLSLNP